MKPIETSQKKVGGQTLRSIQLCWLSTADPRAAEGAQVGTTGEGRLTSQAARSGSTLFLSCESYQLGGNYCFLLFFFGSQKSK